VLAVEGAAKPIEPGPVDETGEPDSLAPVLIDQVPGPVFEKYAASGSVANGDSPGSRARSSARRVGNGDAGLAAGTGVQARWLMTGSALAVGATGLALIGPDALQRPRSCRWRRAGVRPSGP
jgi:hypothetical protein